MSSTPEDILRRLAELPPELAADRRRVVVEAISPETIAPLAAYYAARHTAGVAAQAWATAHGAVGFYAPSPEFAGGDEVHVSTFAFMVDGAPGAPAWKAAGKASIVRHGQVALTLSGRPQGQALREELTALPPFPTYRPALAHLGEPTDLNYKLEDGRGGGGVGFSDGSLHYAAPMMVPVEDGEPRYFIDFPNHNFDIQREAANYAGSGAKYFKPGRLDYVGDPIAWRPSEGWLLILRSELQLLIAQHNARVQRLSADAAEAAA